MDILLQITLERWKIEFCLVYYKRDFNAVADLGEGDAIYWVKIFKKCLKTPFLFACGAETLVKIKVLILI